MAKIKNLFDITRGEAPQWGQHFGENVLKKTACGIKITMKLSLWKRFYIKMQSKYFFPFYKLD